jgi:hypothetical protein
MPPPIWLLPSDASIQRCIYSGTTDIKLDESKRLLRYTRITCLQADEGQLALRVRSGLERSGTCSCLLRNGCYQRCIICSPACIYSRQRRLSERQTYTSMIYRMYVLPVRGTASLKSLWLGTVWDDAHASLQKCGCYPAIEAFF